MRRSQQALSGLLLVLAGLLAVPLGSASTVLVHDDFDTDPASSPLWDVKRIGTGATWDPVSKDVILIDSAPPSSGLLMSTVPLTTNHWRLAWRMEWDHLAGADEGGLVAQFYRDFGGYAGGMAPCDLGFLGAGFANLKGHGFEMAHARCTSGGGPHPLPTPPHYGLLQGDPVAHFATLPSAPFSDGAWHGMMLCYQDGYMVVTRDGVPVMSGTYAFDETFPGWGISGATDSVMRLRIDDVVLVDDSPGLPPDCGASSRCAYRLTPYCGVPCADWPDPAECEALCDTGVDDCEGEDASEAGVGVCPRIRIDPPVTAWIARPNETISFVVDVLEAVEGEGFLRRLSDAHPGLPPGAAFDGATGEFSWTPTAGLAERVILTFEARRPPGAGACVTQRQVHLVPDGDAVDTDRDGVADDQDNCVEVPNRTQADLDLDGQGDACDESVGAATRTSSLAPRRSAGDVDGDGEPDASDVCPTVPDPRQADMDRDGAGDACDLDADGDSAADLGEFADNCPLAPNQDQADADADGIGDACDLAGASAGPAAVATGAPDGPSAPAPAGAVLAAAVALLAVARTRRGGW